MDNNILILGIGGAGRNIINAIHRDSKNSTLRNARYIYADTDTFALRTFKNCFGKPPFLILCPTPAANKIA